MVAPDDVIPPAVTFVMTSELLTVTDTLAVTWFPAPLLATAASVWLPFAAVVVSQVVL